MIIVVTLIAAVLLVIFLVPGAAAHTQVYMESENGDMVVTVASVEIGKATSKGGTEQIEWTRLTPSKGPQDTRDGPVLLGEGRARGEGYTEVRIVFAEVRAVRDGTLHVLHIPQDTLQVRLGQPGAAGDALLVALDAGRSVSQDNGFLSFRPHIVETIWGKGGAEKNEAPVRERAADPEAPASPRPPSQPTTIVTDSSNTGTPKPPQVGWFHVAFIGNGTGLVDSLNVTLDKIGLTHEGAPDDVVTVYENNAYGELVRSPDEGVAEIAAVQVSPGRYTAISFEFTQATATFLAIGQQDLTIPQPRLVLEAPINITVGNVVGLVIELGVEDSIRIGLEGLEFRPVIWDYHVGDSEGRDLKDPYPAQYRTGGSWLPSLGEIGEKFGENDVELNEVPHPIHGDADRDPRSEGSITGLDPDDLKQILGENDLVDGIG